MLQPRSLHDVALSVDRGESFPGHRGEGLSTLYTKSCLKDTPHRWSLDWKGTGSVTIYLYRRYRVVVDIPHAFPETFTEVILTQYLEQVFVRNIKCTLEVNRYDAQWGIS